MGGGKAFNKTKTELLDHLRRHTLPLSGIEASYHSIVFNSPCSGKGRQTTHTDITSDCKAFQLLLSPTADRMEPLHNVVLGPALKDRVACFKPHEIGSADICPCNDFLHVLGNTYPDERNIRGSKLYRQRCCKTSLPSCGGDYCTCQSSIFALFTQSTESTWHLLRSCPPNPCILDAGPSRHRP